MKRAILALLLLVLLSTCDETENDPSEDVARPVRTVEIVDMRDLHSRYFVGSARAAREVALAFRVPGTIVGIDVNVGDFVSEGEVIASLDPAPYQAEVDRLSAELEGAEASFTNARAQTDRQRTLVEKDVAAQATLDRFLAGEGSAAALVKSVQGALDRATLDLAYTRLSAPFSGQVVARFAEDFEEVPAQSPILRMLDADRIEMVIDIPERYISLISEIENITASFDALGDLVIPAEVSEVGTEASATTRTFPVTLLMKQPETARVLPGMTGRASGDPREGHEPFEAILVPASAIFVPEGESNPHVWVFDDETRTVRSRPVVLGTPRSHGVSIKDGLDFGDIVVAAGVNSLREGQEVTLLTGEETQ